MKLNTITKFLCVASVIASPLSFADNIDGAISFTTVPDVSIIQLQALAFGGGMPLTLNDTCVLLVSGTDTPSETDAGISSPAGAPESANYQTRTGQCDNTIKGAAGIYSVSGGSGVPIKITLNALTGTKFNFTPTGTVGNYDGADTANGDSFMALVADTEATVNLANTNDVTNAIAGGAPQAGKTKVFVGGTMTASSNLVAGTTYTESFTIDITY
jgi:hypothetical protein